MRAFRFILLSVAVSLPILGATRVEEWTEDLQALNAQLAAVHPRFKECGLPAELQNRFAQLTGRLGSLSDAEVAVEVEQLLASVGDGHTLLWPFGMKRGAFLRIPVMLWQFDDGIYVVQCSKPEAVGRRVTKIGALPSAEVIRRLETYVSHDNTMQTLWAAPFYATITDFLVAIGAIPGRDAATLTFSEGLPMTFVASDIDPSNLEVKLTAPKIDHPPLYLQHREVKFWHTTFPGGTLYVQVNAIDDSSEKSLTEFGKELRPLLAKSSRVVLDFRLNSGGEARKANELLKALIAFDVSGGQIAVLVGRMTFSAAQTFVTRIDEWTHAVFVGEATGSGPNHYGNERPFRLPNSALRGTIASGINQPVTANDDRKTIEPEIPVSVSASDYFAGRDPVLDAALKALDRQQ